MSALILVESNHSSLHFFTTYFFSFQIETENHFVNFTKGLFDKNITTVKRIWSFTSQVKLTRSWEDYPWWYWLFSLCINNFHSNLLYVFSHNSCWSLMMTVIISFQQANERLLAPSSHVVEVGVWRRRVNISRKCCRAGRAPGTDCRRSRSDWGHSGRCLCPVLLSPPGFSSDTLEC